MKHGVVKMVLKLNISELSIRERRMARVGFNGKMGPIMKVILLMVISKGSVGITLLS